MNVQYISDSVGNTTGVFIPIDEWNELKRKYEDIDSVISEEVPDWHKNIVMERLVVYRKNNEAIDWDDAINDIEKNL